MKNVLSLLLFLLINSMSFSQGYIPPSPDAIGLERLVNMPVSYYTGSTGINIPLAQVGGKELNVPVGLNYNASGIKVGDIAGSVGLGWNLNAGGLITRVVRGLPDDMANGFCTSNFSDTEPDMFYFSFLGQSGKFILSKNGSAIIIPYRPIVIKPGICKSGSTGTWEIVDENGVVYKFGVSTFDRESTTVTEKSGTSKTYVSSWMLSEISSPNSTEKIQFTYTSGGYTNKNFFFTKTKDPCNNDVIRDLTSTSTVQTRYISSISAPFGNIYFTYLPSRKDLPGSYYLSYLRVVGKDLQQITKLKFQYDYFQSPGCSAAECFRLKLDKIYDLAPDPIYNFTYNTTVNLPSRYSKKFDHWGYYNSNTVDSWFPQITLDVTLVVVNYALPNSPKDFVMGGASREPDSFSVSANILTGIAERGGASRQFQYEAHSSGKTGVNEIVGGVRIKAITTYDGLGNSYIRSFKYVSEQNANLSSGFLYKKPKYMAAMVNENRDVFRYLIFSHPLNEIYDLGGVYVGYSRIEESTPSLGKTVYYFTNFDLYPNYVAPDKYVSDFSWKRGNLDSAKVYSQNDNLLSAQAFEYSFDEANKSSVSWEHLIPWSWSCSCGFLCTNSGDPNPRFGYTFLSRPVILKKQTTKTFDPVNPVKRSILVTEYYYDQSTSLINRTVNYDATLPNTKYTTEIKSVMHPDYDFTAHCVAQSNACVANCTGDYAGYCKGYCAQEYGYCVTNFESTASPEASAIIKLRNRHQIIAPVEINNFIGNSGGDFLLSSLLTLYNKINTSGSIIQPKEVRALNQSISQSEFYNSVTTKINADGTLRQSSRLRLLNTFNTYDLVTGNLLRQTSADGVQINYTWDVSNNFVIGTSVTGGVNTRNTSATYKPLLGPLTSTDANLRTTYLEYDVYNRPTVTKDHDGNILSRTRHHYKGETPGFLISVLPDRAEGLVNENFTFRAVDVATSVGGTPQFVWDMGDGTVIDNSSTSVNKSYATAGQYTIKLVGLNPEYGPTTRTFLMGVYNTMSASICANGPTFMDLCGVDPPGYGACTFAQDPYAPVEMIITVSNGCPSLYSYYWEYHNASTNSGWITLNSSASSATFYPPTFEGTYEARCTVTDGCGNTLQSSSYVTLYKSTPDCPGGVIR